MSAEAIARAFEADLPFVGLRDHEHDSELDRIVPPDAARAARALPLLADDERVRVAVADPSADLGALSPYLEGRRVELVVAAREELDAVLGPPPVARPAVGGESPPSPAEPLRGAPPLAPKPTGPEAEPPTPHSSFAEPPPPPPESAAAATSGSEEEAAEKPAAAEPATAAAPAAGGEPSWLKTRRLRLATTLLVLLLLLIIAAGAVAAYPLTR